MIYLEPLSAPANRALVPVPLEDGRPESVTALRPPSDLVALTTFIPVVQFSSSDDSQMEGVPGNAPRGLQPPLVADLQVVDVRCDRLETCALAEHLAHRGQLLLRWPESRFRVLD